MYGIVNNLLHTTRQAMHIVYITFAMFSKHLFGADVGSQFQRLPGKGLLFIQSMRCLLNNLPRVLQ